MALKRAMLKSMGLEEDQITTIIEAHMETVNSLKDDLEKAEGYSEELEKAKKDIKRLQEQVVNYETAQGDEEEWKKKYEAVKAEYDKYKGDREAEVSLNTKRKEYKELLTKANIAEPTHDSILNVTIFDDLKLTEDGKLENADAILKDIQEQWKGFIKQVSVEGANVPNPKNEGGSGFDNMSLAEKMAYVNEHPEDPEVRAFLGKGE